MHPAFMKRAVWGNIEEFPGYIVNRNGLVFSEKSSIMLAQSQNNTTGDLKVNLMKEGVMYTRAVKGLVAATFVPVPDPIEGVVCDHVLVKDLDRANLAAENLEWRPLWYVREYRREVESLEGSPNVEEEQIMEYESGEVFSSILEAAKTYGLLPSLILRSAMELELMFPWGHRFVFLYEAT